MGPNSQSKNPRPVCILDRGTLVIIIRILSLVREESGLTKRMECYLLSEPKIRGYRKHMLSLGMQKGMFWVSEQRLVDQANTICRNSWMTELEIEELERKVTWSDSVILEEAGSVEALPDQVGEDVLNVLLEMGGEEQANSLDEEEVAIVMEIAEVIERVRKDMLQALRNVP